MRPSTAGALVRWPLAVPESLIVEIAKDDTLFLLVEDKQTRRLFPAERKVGELCWERCIDQGLISRAIRNVMALSPPLVATRSDIDEIVLRLVAGIDETARLLRSGGWRG